MSVHERVGPSRCLATVAVREISRPAIQWQLDRVLCRRPLPEHAGNKAANVGHERYAAARLRTRPDYAEGTN